MALAHGFTRELTQHSTLGKSVQSKCIAFHRCQSIELFWKKNKAKYEQTPKKLVIDAADACHQQGSSTLVLLTLDPKELELHAAYIGGIG
jgi:predicted RNA-binding protein with RPS1 domain